MEKEGHYLSGGEGRVVFFFFFQAEDGIRDLTVTGVQTCALPICDGVPVAVADRCRARGRPRPVAGVDGRPQAAVSGDLGGAAAGGGAGRGGRRGRKSGGEGKRVDLGGRRIIKKKKEEERCGWGCD